MFIYVNIILFPLTLKSPIGQLFISCFIRFPFAREMKRKIIFHAGPTNSGKTHTAIERFRAADTGLYCGPLRLLATEVFMRTNDSVSKVMLLC